MLKRLVRSSFRKMGYSIARGNPSGEIANLQQQLAVSQKALAESAQKPAPVSTDAAGYKAAYEQVSGELTAMRAALGKCQQDLDGYKNAYDTVCTQLSDTNVVLRQNKIDPEIVKEAALPDPPVLRRLGENTTALAAVKAEIERQQIPADVAKLFLDPNFSMEDRSKYMQLRVVNPPLWDRMAAVVARVVDGQYLKYAPRSADPALAKVRADTLRREGVVPLGQVLDSRQVHDVQDYFLKRPIFNGHIPMSARHRVLRRYVNYTAEKYPIGCYSVQEIALAPHLLEFALSPAILDMAASYFGCAPRLTWLQSWWNFAGPGDYPHRQNFYHRDSNDFGMFWVYMYLTDVDEESGPHKLIRRSGDFEVVRERFEKAKANPALAKQLEGITIDDLNGLGHGISDDVKEAIFDGLAEVMTGPAGTAFITRGIDYHKVVVPLTKKRQIYAARFCINEFNYPGPDRDGDPVPSEVVAERVGSDEQLRYITGLRFDWNNWASS